MYTTGLRASLSKVRKQILSRESSAAPGVDTQLHAGTCWPDVLSQHPACGVRKACPCLSAPRPQPPLSTPPPLGQSTQSSGAAGSQGQGTRFFPSPLGARACAADARGPPCALSWCRIVLVSQCGTQRPATGKGRRGQDEPGADREGKRAADGIRAGGLVGAGKRNGKENKTLRPDPKGQLSVGQGQSLCLLGQWEPGRGLEQEVGARCREMK